MMMNKMQSSARNANTVGRFLEMIRKADSRRSRSGLDFYTRSAVPALLTAQSAVRQEQL